MFEDFWNGILELTSKFVIPDWGIGRRDAAGPDLRPDGASSSAVLFWKLCAPTEARPAARAASNRCRRLACTCPVRRWRRSSRRSARSCCSSGLVFGGPLLIIGAIGLTVTLLYWLAEAVRLYDHDLGSTVPALPDGGPRRPAPGRPHAGSVVPAVPRRVRDGHADARPRLRGVAAGGRRHRTGPDACSAG